MRKRKVRVLISACGGSTGIDIARSLRYSNLNLFLVGMDIAYKGRVFGRELCDKVVAAPDPGDGFAKRVEKICKENKIDVVILNHSKEIGLLAKQKRKLRTFCLLPSFKVINICSDKWKTARALSETKYIPWSLKVEKSRDVDKAFLERKGPFWLRLTIGLGGKRSILVKKVEQAKSWISYWKEINSKKEEEWILQEYLPGKNASWLSVWQKGKLKASGAWERLEYYISSAAVSGVSGQASIGKTIVSKEIERLGIEVVKKIAREPNGIFVIDVRYDKKGEPKVTEVENRLSGRPWLLAKAGVNLAEVIVKCFLKLPVKRRRVKEGVMIYRQLDMEPVIRFKKNNG